uniref:Putative ribonuclease II n=1 Tax=Paulinella micropora TaxID=1928728 RepID=A0A1L5YB61_9EUKA|nr:putative ribonuclease II [Paulinella micropora]AQX44703.1 putative ribonuclease II [Paulinella micropora]
MISFITKLNQRFLQSRYSLENILVSHLSVDYSHWVHYELLCLQSSPWSNGFTQDQIDNAHQLSGSANETQASDTERVNLTRLRCFTLDEPGTQELDDALSYEKDEEGREWIWVHIADPDRLITAGSNLDLEARRRATSIYLASGTLPMFPVELAGGALSLRQGERCAALSAAIHLDESGGLNEVIFHRSWISLTYRLTYEDGDELIDLGPIGDQDLTHISRLMSLRRGWRQRQGALELEQAEGRFCQDGETIGIEIIETSPARQMVAEAMILMGATFAEIGKRENLPLPYRGQQSAELPLLAELKVLPEGPVRHAAIKRCLSRGTIGTKPTPHFSLGLSGYAQATSPIRRYSDLILQRQLLSWQSGKQTLTESELAELTDSLEPVLKQATQIAREDQKHWQQVWFEKHRCKQWPAQFLRWLREHDQLALIYIDSLSLELVVTSPQNSEPGDRLVLIVESVDSSMGFLSLRAIAA